MRAWWCVAWDGVGSEGSDVVMMVMVWRWCYGGLRWRRVAASGYGDRVDRAGGGGGAWPEKMTGIFSGGDCGGRIVFPVERGGRNGCMS
ncbi:hypothetical protein Tco_0106503, partial [Tanacetum coccineum]